MRGKKADGTRRTKLTNEQCSRLRALFIDGRKRDAAPDRTRRALAEQFKIAPGTVSRILHEVTAA